MYSYNGTWSCHFPSQGNYHKYTNLFFIFWESFPTANMNFHLMLFPAVYLPHWDPAHKAGGTKALESKHYMMSVCCCMFPAACWVALWRIFALTFLCIVGAAAAEADEGCFSLALASMRQQLVGQGESRECTKCCLTEDALGGDQMILSHVTCSLDL